MEACALYTWVCRLVATCRLCNLASYGLQSGALQDLNLGPTDHESAVASPSTLGYERGATMRWRTPKVPAGVGKAAGRTVRWVSSL